MHIPDGFLDPKLSGGLVGAAAAILGYCVGKVLQAVTCRVPQKVLAAAGNALGNLSSGTRYVLTQVGEDRLRRMGLVAAWIFAAQLFNFPIASGTSGHLVGGVFSAVLLGPFAGPVVLAVVLLVQALIFSDGGILALGANLVNMAVLGSGAAYFVYAALKRILPEWVAMATAAWLSVMLAALACALEIGWSGSIRVQDVVPAMLGVHAWIGLAEAAITLGLIYLFRRGEESRA